MQAADKLPQDPSNSLATRIPAGLIAQGFSQSVNLFIRVAEVSLFLTCWGPVQYGEWLMVAAIPVYLSIADGGFTRTCQREMTMSCAAGNRDDAIATFQSTWGLLLIVSFLLLFIAIIATTSVPLVHWLNLQTISDTSLSAVIVLLTMQIIVGFQIALLYGGYCCVGKYARGTAFMSFTTLMEFICLALVVMFGGDAAAAAAALFFGRTFGLLLMFIDIRNMSPWLKFSLRFASKGKLNTLLKPSMASMAFPLGDALNVHGMRLVVGLLLGPSEVAAFSSIRTLCRAALTPVVAITRLTEPEIAIAYGAGQLDVVRMLFTRSCQLGLWSVIVFGSVIWIAGDSIYAHWTHQQFQLDQWHLAILLLASAINSIWYTALMVPFATNRHAKVAVAYSAAYGGGALLLAIVLTYLAGANGPCLAVAAGELFMGIVVLPIALHQSNKNVGSWVKDIISPPLFIFNFRPH